MKLDRDQKTTKQPQIRLKLLARFLTGYIVTIFYLTIVYLVSPWTKPMFGSEFSLFALIAILTTSSLVFGLGPSLITSMLSSGFYYLLVNPINTVEHTATLHISILLFSYGIFVGLLGQLMQKKTRFTFLGKRRLNALLDQSIHPIILQDKKGMIVYASTSISFTLKFASKELLKKEIHDYVYAQDQKTYQKFSETISHQPGKRITAQFRIKRKDGGIIWVQNDAINLLYDPDIQAVVMSLRDITQQKQLDEQIFNSLQREKQARETAEQAIRTRDEFLSIASHELKTPLTTIILQLQSTLHHTLTQSLANFSGEKLVQSLSIAEQQSKRLAAMIKDLLELSLVSTGRIGLTKEKADINRITRSLIERLGEQAKQAGCTVTYQQSDTPVFASLDIVRIEQCITNLLTNTFKYAAEKPVEVTLKRDGKSARISVADQGVGINPEDQKIIFKPFKRVAGNGTIKGLGVGLFIARQIARAHNGDITVNSTLKKGSIFTLQLPLIAE